MEIYKILLDFLDNDPRISYEPGSYVSFINPDFVIRADAYGQRGINVFYKKKRVFEAKGNKVYVFERGEWEDEIRSEEVAGEFFENYEKKLQQIAKDVANKTRMVLEEQNRTEVNEELAPIVNIENNSSQGVEIDNSEVLKNTENSEEVSEVSNSPSMLSDYFGNNVNNNPTPGVINNNPEV